MKRFLFGRRLNLMDSFGTASTAVLFVGAHWFIAVIAAVVFSAIGVLGERW